MDNKKALKRYESVIEDINLDEPYQDESTQTD